MKPIDLDEIDLKANPGAFSTFDMAVHVPEVRKLHPGDFYLEVGVDKGKSLSVAKMVATRGVQVYGVDLRSNPKIRGTHFIQGDSSEIAKKWTRKIGVLFIDGDHTYEGCKADIDSWYPHMKKHGVMLFHDCDESSPGVVQAVKEFVEGHTIKEVYYDPNPRCSMARIRL
jgi:hypothetical protein